jgi:hypothetical protein
MQTQRLQTAPKAKPAKPKGYIRDQKGTLGTCSLGPNRQTWMTPVVVSWQTNNNKIVRCGCAKAARSTTKPGLTISILLKRQSNRQLCSSSNRTALEPLQCCHNKPNDSRSLDRISCTILMHSDKNTATRIPWKHWKIKQPGGLLRMQAPCLLTARIACFNSD